MDKAHKGAGTRDRTRGGSHRCCPTRIAHAHSFCVVPASAERRQLARSRQGQSQLLSSAAARAKITRWYLGPPPQTLAARRTARGGGAGALRPAATHHMTSHVQLGWHLTITPVPPLEGSARPFSARRSSACAVSFTVMPTRGWQSRPTSFSCAPTQHRRRVGAGRAQPARQPVSRAPAMRARAPAPRRWRGSAHAPPSTLLRTYSLLPHSSSPTRTSPLPLRTNSQPRTEPIFSSWAHHVRPSSEPWLAMGERPWTSLRRRCARR